MALNILSDSIIRVVLPVVDYEPMYGVFVYPVGFQKCSYEYRRVALPKYGFRYVDVIMPADVSLLGELACPMPQ
jgi:hypothetical protein